MEAVLAETVRLLDESGESALTFRALAARLGGGVGSIYWYVQGKDELLDRAADHVLASVLEKTERFVDEPDPIDALRQIALALFTSASERPWLSNYFLRNTGFQPNSLRFYERVGGQVLRLHLTPKQTFDATSAVIGFVVGAAADLGQEPPPEVVSGGLTREEFLNRVVTEWSELDEIEFPFIHTILEEFRDHDDAEQFRGGLDLLLDGLRRQAEQGPGSRR